MAGSRLCPGGIELADGTFRLLACGIAAAGIAAWLGMAATQTPGAMTAAKAQG